MHAVTLKMLALNHASTALMYVTSSHADSMLYFITLISICFIRISLK